MSTSGGQFGFTLNGEAGRTYVLEVSTNLVNWVPLATNTFAGATWNFSEVIDPGTSGRFYRVLLITP